MPRMFLASLLAVALAACGDPPLIDRPEEEPIRESFQQLKASSIDVLFVIDNSRSMREEQEALATNFARFLQYLDPDPARPDESGQVDYRIAVTTTDASRSGGRLVRARAEPAPAILQPGAGYDPLDVMQRTIANIQEGGALEAGFEAALLAAERAAQEKDGAGRPMFLRENAYLYVVIVSDEEDASFGEVRYYHRRFETLKGRGNENAVAISAIAGPVPNGCETADAGFRYAELARLTGGVHGNVCTDDWGATLEQLAVTGIGLQKRFQLREAPCDLDVPEGIGPEDFLSVAIHYPCSIEDDAPQLAEKVCASVERRCGGDRGSVICVPWFADSDGWIFDERQNALVFEGDAVPGPGSTLEVEYFPRDK